MNVVNCCNLIWIGLIPLCYIVMRELPVAQFSIASEFKSILSVQKTCFVSGSSLPECSGVACMLIVPHDCVLLHCPLEIITWPHQIHDDSSSKSPGAQTQTLPGLFVHARKLQITFPFSKSAVAQQYMTSFINTIRLAIKNFDWLAKRSDGFMCLLYYLLTTYPQSLL